MNPIDFQNAFREKWDVVLVGSSFAACFFAHSLKGRGLKVLFVERGTFLSREAQLDRRFDTQPPAIAQKNTSGQKKDWIARSQFGGGSNCWWGNTPRLLPSDLELLSRYGLGQDWALPYSELEPYLLKAETLMDVAGSDPANFGARSAPFPFPAHAPTLAEQRLFKHGTSWQAMPCARSNGGRRANCCTTGTCSLCPIDAKFTILNSVDLFSDEGFFFTTETECRTIETSAGIASAITVRRPDGAFYTIKADFIGLAANPISNAAILLRSGLGSDLVGQGLHEQVGQFVWMDIPFDNYFGGTSITGLGYGFYDGAFRSEAASVLIESWNAPPSLRLENGKWLQKLKLKLVAEDLPLPENKVVLEDDEQVILWTGHSDYSYAGLKRAREQLPDLIPFEFDNLRFGDFQPTEAHIIGGTPMAAGPSTGVVGKNGRLFDVANVACLGAGVFPTGAAANPTLTLSALSLYFGDQL